MRSLPAAGRVVRLIALFCLPTAVGAQSDSAAATLDPVVVTVTRGTGRSVLSSPFALTVVRPDSARPGQRHASIDESLALVPGLSVTNRNNPSQDARLSIRGFGSRSAFGVRGIRVLRDGMPLTLPDGQTPLDYMSLESVGNIEVMRGAASALYGNASGGIVDIRTASPSASAVSAEARQWVGSNGYLRSVLAMSGTAGRLSYVGDVARFSGDGSRSHSRQRAATGFGRATFASGRGSYSLSVLALENPLAQNPGALTIEEMRADPGAADPLSVRRRARKAVTQLQVGLTADQGIGDGGLSFYAFGGSRSLDNPLTFAVVEIGRHSHGAGASARRNLSVLSQRHRLSAGIDFQSQNDLRRNYATCADTIARTAPTATCPDVRSDRGIVTLDQRELVSSTGVYVNDDIDVTSRLSLAAGIRADRVRFEVRDRLVSAGNPDDSGERSLSSVSPIAGAVMRVSRASSVYANVSSAFETPTATELGNQPDGSAGLNTALEAQKSVTTELGWKGFAGAFLTYDLAVFRTRVHDELVPFEIPASNGRRYFRNAGRTMRRGAEAGATLSRRGATLMLSYNYSSFRFDDFVVAGADFAGNRIPGIPAHRGQAAVSVSRPAGFAVLETELVGRSYVDDANTVRSPGYAVVHLRSGFTPLRGSPRLAVTMGIQNIFDRHYAASIAVNAARGRYYEPSPERSWFLGMTVGHKSRQP